MKNLTYFILLTFLILLIISCNKEDIQSLILKAGIYNEDMVYHECAPDTVPGLYTLDMNEDGTSDIKISCSAIRAPSGHDYKSEIAIIDSSFQFKVTADSVSPIIISFNDTIANAGVWSNKPAMQEEYFKLARDYYLWVINVSDYYTYWLNKTGYIGIRKEYSAGIFKYGWIKISVEIFTQVIIYEYAFVK